MINLNDIKEYTSKYEQYDDYGRLIFKGFCIGQNWCKPHKMSKDIKSSWDVSYYSGQTRIMGEIKVRNKGIDTWDTWILEINKLKKLFEIRDKLIKKNPKQPEPRIHYINIFNDNQIAIWDITSIDINTIEVVNTLMPKEFVGSRDKINKDSIFLNINNAIINTSK